jgi:hypothetical protein
VAYTFRNGGASGHGVGRIRFYVDDFHGRCLGSIEGKTGDYRLDADYKSENGTAAPPAAKPYRTRLDAAEALAALHLKNEQPPIGRPEYALLVRYQRRVREPLPAVQRGLARMLCGRGLMVEVASDFRTTSAGVAEIKRFEGWEASSKTAATKPQPTE